MKMLHKKQIILTFHFKKIFILFFKIKLQQLDFNCNKLNKRHRLNVNMRSKWCCRQHKDVLLTLERRPASMESRRYSISSLSKSFVDSKNSTISDSILLFVEILYLDDPYNKMFTRSSDCQECGGFQGVSIFV